MTSEHSGTDVIVEIWGRYFEGEEGGRIYLPVALEGLPSDVRRRLAGDILVVALRDLAALRGVSTSVLDEVVTNLQEQDYRFVAHGPWKSSPDRKLKARLRFVLHDDGFGRIAVELNEAGPIVIADHLIGGTTSDSFKRAVKSMRWFGSGQIGFSNGAAFRPESFVVDVEHGLIEGRVVQPSDDTGSEFEPKTLPAIKSRTI